jgi:hypothetical protein
MVVPHKNTAQVTGINVHSRKQTSNRKPLRTFSTDDNGYPILPEPRQEDDTLQSQKELIRSFMTATYSKQ